MWIESLKLLNFRNYESFDAHFHPHLNLIYGNNGEGKTNLVEAIYVLGLTRSFRLVNDKILIRQNSLITKIEGNVYNRYTTNYKLILSKDGKKVKINNNKVLRLSDYVSKINIILFHPDDLRIIKDTPSIRRKNLNIDISQMDIVYLRYLNDYNKILKQRNAYLKQLLINGNNGTDYLNILTEKLVDVGLKIFSSRKSFLFKLNDFLKDIYPKISNDGFLEIKYHSDYDLMEKQQLLDLYQKSLKKDLLFGKTNIGVHTDDFTYLLNEFDLKDYGSEGQQKNAIIAMKFAEMELFKKDKGFYPILILDDIFSELDQIKIKNILNFIREDIQTFITTTNVENFSFLQQRKYKSFKIENGKILEVIEYEK